jgi:hypothetical protein
MKLNLNNLLTDLESFKPDTLSSIVSFVRAHSDYSKITMMVRNSLRSVKILLKTCEILSLENSSISDIKLAGLLVIMADVNIRVCEELMSSASKGIGNSHWSRAMAASYLIRKEVLNETIRKSA